MREFGNRRCILGQFDSDQHAGKRSMVVEILKIQIMIRRQIFPAFVGVAVLRLKPVADHKDKVGIENLRGSKQRPVVEFSFHVQTADSVKAVGSHKFVLLSGAGISVTALRIPPANLSAIREAELFYKPIFRFFGIYRSRQTPCDLESDIFYTGRKRHLRKAARCSERSFESSVDRRSYLKWYFEPDKSEIVCDLRLCLKSVKNNSSFVKTIFFLFPAVRKTSVYFTFFRFRKRNKLH